MDLRSSGQLPLPRHLYTLDALRGVAAFGIVIFHWQHFFPMGTAREGFPLFGLLQPFYEQGFRAVNLFFCLSGFIFFWLYGKALEERSISLVKFGWLRFTRLYPLHLATLLLVLGGQSLMMARWQHYFVFPANDIYHFILHLFLASGWGLQTDNSFNVPVWSVSVEVLLYAVFAAACRMHGTKWWHAATLMIGGAFLMPLNPLIGQGLFGFFAGGLSFKAFVKLREYRPRRLSSGMAVVVLTLLWIAIPWIKQNNLVYETFRNVLGEDWGMVRGRHLGDFAVLTFTSYVYEGFLFPITILILALSDSGHPRMRACCVLLGNSSYSSYLLHFPLQLACMLMVLQFGINPAIFHSPWTLGAFVFLLAAISLASFRWFEHPAQEWLRRRYFKTTPADQEILCGKHTHLLDAPRTTGQNKPL